MACSLLKPLTLLPAGPCAPGKPGSPAGPCDAHQHVHIHRYSSNCILLTVAPLAPGFPAGPANPLGPYVRMYTCI